MDRERRVGGSGGGSREEEIKREKGEDEMSKNFLGKKKAQHSSGTHFRDVQRGSTRVSARREMHQ